MAKSVVEQLDNAAKFVKLYEGRVKDAEYRLVNNTHKLNYWRGQVKKILQRQAKANEKKGK